MSMSIGASALKEINDFDRKMVEVYNALVRADLYERQNLPTEVFTHLVRLGLLPEEDSDLIELDDGLVEIDIKISGYPLNYTGGYINIDDLPEGTRRIRIYPH